MSDQVENSRTPAPTADHKRINKKLVALLAAGLGLAALCLVTAVVGIVIVVKVRNAAAETNRIVWADASRGKNQLLVEFQVKKAKNGISMYDVFITAKDVEPGKKLYAFCIHRDISPSGKWEMQSNQTDGAWKFGGNIRLSDVEEYLFTLEDRQQNVVWEKRFNLATIGP